jgi:hypothetical protein
MRYKQSDREKQEREQEKAAQIAAGLVSERYARISGIEFRMTYYHRARDPILMERTLRFSPANYARFHVKCEQDGCTGGGYDLSPAVEGLAKSGKTSVKGTLFCHGSNGTIGHGSIAYEINIQYHRRAQ